MIVKERKLSTTVSAPAQRAGTGGADATSGGAKPRGKRRRLLLAAGALVVLALASGAGWFLFVREAPPPPPPKPGEVLALEPISVNLAEGRYLKLGIALQMAYTGAKEEPDGSKALDLAIDRFTGMSMAELSDPARRKQVKEELLVEVEEAYHGEVLDLYLTEFVMQ